jgi:hypothetical protein
MNSISYQIRNEMLQHELDQKLYKAIREEAGLKFKINDERIMPMERAVLAKRKEDWIDGANWAAKIHNYEFMRRMADVDIESIKREKEIRRFLITAFKWCLCATILFMIAIFYIYQSEVVDKESRMQIILTYLGAMTIIVCLIAAIKKL